MCVCVFLNIYMKHIDTDNSIVTARGKGEWGGRERWGKGGKTGMERDFALANGHITQCAGYVLFRCALETCVVL